MIKKINPAQQYRRVVTTTHNGTLKCVNQLRRCFHVKIRHVFILFFIADSDLPSLLRYEQLSSAICWGAMQLVRLKFAWFLPNFQVWCIRTLAGKVLRANIADMILQQHCHYGQYISTCRCIGRAIVWWIRSE